MDNGSTARPPLRPYQADGLAFLRRNPRAFLADEMGLGKTRQIVEACEGRTLVVAPAMVLDGGTWVDELERWSDDPGRFTTVPYTSINAREPAGPVRIAKDGHKYQSASRPIPQVRPDLAGHWDTLVLDEAHYIKGRDTLWTKALLKLGKKADRVILATGTPIPNWSNELFTSLQMLRPADAKPGGLFGSYYRWAESWFDTTPEQVYIGGKVKEVPHVGDLLACGPECWNREASDPCKHYHAFIRENLGGLFLQRLRDEVLTDLPPLTVTQVLTPMAPVQAKAYAKMKKEWLAELPDGMLKVAWSAGARHVMLDKLATGMESFDPSYSGSSGKLARLREDLANRSRPTLVVAHYRASVEAAGRVAESLGLRTRYVHGGVARRGRGDAVREFKAGRVDVLVGSLETIAEGLTLTQADLVIFLEHSYKPSRNQQAVRRIHRLGQDRPCTMLDYVTPGTIDEGKRELLATKTDHQMRVLTAAQLYHLA